MDNQLRNLPPLSRFKPFEAAARLESFSLAAAELGMTQTAISKQIAQLESDLGTTLFERRNRAVFLTGEGRRLGQVVSTALSSIASEVAYIRGDGRSDELILHCQLCEAFYWLMPRLARFHERHPGTELRVMSALKPLTEAQTPFDVAIQTTGRPSGTAKLAFTVSDEIFPVCAPSLIDPSTLPLDPDDLAAYSLLSHRVIPQDWMDWPDWFEAFGVAQTSERFTHFDSFPIVLQAAVAGQGVALGWKRTVQGMIDEGKLIRPCRETVVHPAELAVYQGSGGKLHPMTKPLLAWLSDELSE
ncbi:MULTISPECIES: LysR substrate-binding domain-containing protein [unclassified Leisingera]|uniref:LysR substrate-binding domain-containing protein n=1 Tax=unclassified Leisingera TaxID=2614906 RepID=UPI000803B256|nr:MULTISPECIES: LysR substrate-binding domain-containing protein [unclassified Leisingera]NSY39768.1 LysR family transcriptional regulator [Leisingera sp. ANG59]OBY24880.1 LysR family transcriptional regulator [Leisingera sp. JC1]